MSQSQSEGRAAHNTEGAWHRLETSWRSLESSLLLRVRLIRVEASYLRATIALAMGQTGIAVATAAVRRMERECASWADALALLVRAGIAIARGDRDALVPCLRSAISGFDATACECTGARHGRHPSPRW